MSATESKLKVGDRFRRTAAVGYEGVDYRSAGYEDAVGALERDGVLDTRGNFHKFANIELVASGPIRTVTRREIVPGEYGKVFVDAVDGDGIRARLCRSLIDASELREAAHIFNQIAEALEENAKEAA